MIWKCKLQATGDDTENFTNYQQWRSCWHSFLNLSEMLVAALKYFVASAVANFLQFLCVMLQHSATESRLLKL